MNSEISAADLTESQRQRIRVAQLEADMAYFEARLVMIGAPATRSERAQRRAFKALLKATSAAVEAIKAASP